VGLSVIVLGVPVGVVIARLEPSARHAGRPAPSVSHHKKVPVLVASSDIETVDAAVDKTVASGSYAFMSTLSETGGTPPPESLSPGATSSGVATLDPQASSAVTYPTCYTSGISVRTDGAHVWDSLSPSTPTEPPAGNWTVADLGTTQSAASSCFGSELGALATVATCSPSVQLGLSRQVMTGATLVGPVTVAGQPAEQYAVTIDPVGYLGQPDSTPEENAAIGDALAAIGPNPASAMVDVNADGYVVEADLSVTYADDVTATRTIDLSDFGGAGTIVLPPAAPPTNG